MGTDLHSNTICLCLLQNTLKGEESKAFNDWFKSRNLIQLSQLKDKRSGSKVIIGCVHIAYSPKQPSLQMLQVNHCLCL